ncbi:Chaperone DnaJ-domain superfamily protein [Perilla frutescens var. hirtella]|uniref:Chaperone DnaJ-domain superfamily protein n=1 Tax=Perilla frutescens var. hirtella TaxID=608512 RepID=A0AAD4PEN4_PERFH|nr:Chaperone DnaJ-domain superfamily protein [Perilla frutescens var. frutescens]KAH6776361.1 Chaperone DnaJ-domain superfamily protein [Perilla frutescens var. hirtella]KAH6836320.1 Chaperone DnaJ-domain superfamily protein [Perilla frutescens var. hirtella]
MSKDEEDKRNQDNPWQQPNKGYQEKEQDMKLWGIVIFGLIGATVTTFAVSQLRRTANWVYTQLSSSGSTWKNGQKDGRSFRSSFQEEAWKRYNRRMQEEYEEEMERVERIRRMQSVFNRERNKYKRGYESWQEQGPNAYHQHFQRNDWYWKADTSYRDQRSNFRETPRASANAPLSHHYSVLGLDRRRTKPYTDEEIKSAFRTKAKEFHPDQNQENKEYAETKFKEVMVSYEAIKSERKNNGTNRRP